ncbi:hypothetical protein AB9F46_35725, partial [Rhizobium leguminosarum]
GPAAGVRAVQQAWQAAVAYIPLETYAKDHPELAASIAKFSDGKSTVDTPFEAKASMTSVEPVK